MFFGDSSAAVSGDLRAATALATLMESSWGMGPGRASPPDERIESALGLLLERTERVLRERRREVLCLAHALETYGTLGGDDVAAVVERSPGPLVDGGRYACDDLYQELEDYHHAAARAHRERGRIDRAFPGLVREPVAVDQIMVRGPARPEFVPVRAPYVPEPLPAPAPGRRLWVVTASALTLLVLAIFTGLAVTGGPVSGTATSATGSEVASPGLLLLLFVVLVAVTVGAGLAVVAVKGVRARQARAERDREQAQARAQFLAAALDPDTAMRLLGYDGRGRRESV